MKKYSNEDIRRIISDVRASINVNSLRKQELVCLSAEELISDLSQYAKYVIPEKREEWCDLIRSIIYDVEVMIPPILSNSPNMTSQVIKAFENKDNKICNEIFYFIWVSEIMAAYSENNDLNAAILVFNNQEHNDITYFCVIREVLRFAMFGPKFVELVIPNIIDQNNSFKRNYLEAKKYFETRRALEQRLVNAISSKKRVSLDEYKEYLINTFSYPCDNTEERKDKRREKLSKISDAYLQDIIDNTYCYAKYLLKKMQQDNQELSDNIYTTVEVEEDFDFTNIDLGLTGGYHSDKLFQVSFCDQRIFVSKYLLTRILKNISIEEDYDVCHSEDGDICCDYVYPKLVFVMKIDDFNRSYTELIEDRSLGRKE